MDLEDLESEDIFASNSLSNKIIGGRSVGAIETWQHSSIFKNNTFIDNIAIRNGGGVVSYESSIWICSFSSNMAGRHSGSVILGVIFQSPTLHSTIIQP